MNRIAYPYVARCAYCQQGLLRVMQCNSCKAFIAVCDECELAWSNIPAVSKNTSEPSTASFPTCPKCQDAHASWSRLSREEIIVAKLQDYVAGDSE